MPRTRSKRTAKKIRFKDEFADNPNAILYTPVSRVPLGKSKEEKDEDKLAKTVRKLVVTLGQPELHKHVRDGIRLFNYMYNATKAAERGAMPPFPGLDIEPVTVTTTRKRGRLAMAVVEMMNTVILEQLRTKEFLSKIKRGGTETK